MRKLLLIPVALLLGWELVYVATINVMLRGGSLERLINGGTEDAQVKLEGGWSLWPGLVHLDRVHFRFQDRNLQFAVTVDNAVVNIGLLALPAKTIHLESVRGDNVSYRLRHKVDQVDVEGMEKRLAAYPKIEGFPDPPLITENRTPPLTDAEYNLWTVHLEDADVQVRELWFQEYRFVGRGRATGGFRLQPERDAQTYPCRLELDGTLHAGPHVAANSFRGTLGAQLHRHDPRQVQGEAIFEKISLELDLRGDVPNLSVTELYTDANTQVTRGAGQLRLEADLQQGLWTEGSKVRFTTDGVTVRKDAVTVSGPAELEARIVQGGKDARVALSADVPRASLHLRGVPARFEPPSFRRVRATLGATANLAQPLRLTSLSGEARAIVPDLGWLNHPLESPDLFRGGNAEANAKLQWSEGKRGSGNLEFEMERAAFVVLEQSMVVSGKLVAAGSYDANTKRGSASKFQLDLPDVGVGKEMLPGGLHVRSERLHWQHLPPAELEGRFELTSQTLEQLVPLIISSSILRAVSDAVVNLGPTRAVVEVKRTPSSWELRLEEAKSGDVEAYGQMRGEKDLPDPCGRWYLQDGVIRVGIEHAAGKSTVEPLVSPSWWRETPAAARCAQPGKARPTVRAGGSNTRAK